LGGSLEEEIVQNFFVLKDQRIQFMGKGDNDMKVMGWEESLVSVLEPFGLAQTLAFGTMAVATGVVGDAGESAVLVTDIDVSP
jgi:hypothetical protein